MAIGSVSGQGRQARFAAAAFRRSFAFHFHASFLYRWRYAGPVPERLLIAPIDLRTADPTVALDIYAGRFVFSGEGLDAKGLPIFDVEPRERRMVAPAPRLRLAPASPRHRHGDLALQCAEPGRRVDPLHQQARRGRLGAGGGGAAHHVVAVAEPAGARRLRPRLLPPLHALAHPAGALSPPHRL